LKYKYRIQNIIFKHNNVASKSVECCSCRHGELPEGYGTRLCYFARDKPSGAESSRLGPLGQGEAHGIQPFLLEEHSHPMIVENVNIFLLSFYSFILVQTKTKTKINEKHSNLIICCRLICNNHFLILGIQQFSLNSFHQCTHQLLLLRI